MILIDMPMPSDCMFCRFRHEDNDFCESLCCADEEERPCNFYERPDWCPLQEVRCKAWETGKDNE